MQSAMVIRAKYVCFEACVLTCVLTLRKRERERETGALVLHVTSYSQRDKRTMKKDESTELVLYVMINRSLSLFSAYIS